MAKIMANFRLKTRSALNRVLLAHKIIRKSHKTYIKAEVLREFSHLRTSVPPKLPGAAPTGVEPAVRNSKFSMKLV
jgi:hypothetical protein